MLPTVLLTEGATAAGIVALLPLPYGAALALLPVIGMALNGTSSVLYGTVPDLVTVQQRERAFGVFYTGTIGAGALSPALYGLFGDTTRSDAGDATRCDGRALDAALGMAAHSAAASHARGTVHRSELNRDEH